MKILERRFDESQTIEDFRKVAWFYDLWGRLTESKAINKVLGLASVENGISVLEVACGTGIVLEKVIKENPAGRNVGIDISPDMIAKARKRLENLGPKAYELKQGNALDLEFADGSFDRVINNYMVDLMPEEMFGRIAGEFYRVLKPGGILVMSTFSFGTKKIHRFWLNVAKKYPGLLTGCRPVSFSEHLEKAGFTIENDLQVSQNTFPSEVIKAAKY